jgi:hypothetical protein
MSATTSRWRAVRAGRDSVMTVMLRRLLAPAVNQLFVGRCIDRCNARTAPAEPAITAPSISAVVCVPSNTC